MFLMQKGSFLISDLDRNLFRLRSRGELCIRVCFICYIRRCGVSAGCWLVRWLDWASVIGVPYWVKFRFFFMAACVYAFNC